MQRGGASSTYDQACRWNVPTVFQHPVGTPPSEGVPTLEHHPRQLFQHCWNTYWERCSNVGTPLNTTPGNCSNSISLLGVNTRRRGVNTSGATAFPHAQDARF